MRGDQETPGAPLVAKIGGYGILAVAALAIASFLIVVAGPYLVVGGLVAAAAFVAFKLTRALRSRGIDAVSTSSAVATQLESPKSDIARRRIDPGR